MATMIPENVEEFKADGEKRFYKLLEASARPDTKHITLHTPKYGDLQDGDLRVHKIISL